MHGDTSEDDRWTASAEEHTVTRYTRLISLMKLCL